MQRGRREPAECAAPPDDPRRRGRIPRLALERAAGRSHPPGAPRRDDARCTHERSRCRGAAPRSSRGVATCHRARARLVPADRRGLRAPPARRGAAGHRPRPGVGGADGARARRDARPRPERRVPVRRGPPRAVRELELSRRARRSPRRARSGRRVRPGRHGHGAARVPRVDDQGGPIVHLGFKVEFGDLADADEWTAWTDKIRVARRDRNEEIVSAEKEGRTWLHDEP